MAFEAAWLRAETGFCRMSLEEKNMKQYLMSIRWPIRRNESGERIMSLRSHIFWFFALPFVLLFGAVMWVAESMAHDSALVAAAQKFELVSTESSSALQRLEEPARTWLNGMTGSTGQGLDEGGAFTAVKPHFEFLQRHAHIAAVFFGYSNGDFARVLAIRNPDTRALVKAPAAAVFAAQSIRHQPDGSVDELWRFYDAKQVFVGQESRAFERFDPRQRPWYTSAAKSSTGQISATEPYLFAKPRVLGVTLSAPLGGNRGGIGGVDFSLDGLSEYFAGQPGPAGRQLLLFDAAGRIWAWSDRAAMAALLARGQLPLMENLQDPGLRSIRASMATSPNQPAFEHAARAGQRWVLDVSPATGIAVNGLSLASAQPAAQVFADARRVRWMILSLMGLGLVIGVLVIRALATRLSAPLWQLAGQAQSLERFEFSAVQTAASPVREIRTAQSAVRTATIALAGYARYVPRPIVQHYLAIGQLPKLGVESRDIVYLHAELGSRLHGFGASNELAFAQLEVLSKHVHATHGLVDRYQNQAMGALWGAPLVQKSAALRACEAAFCALEELRASNLSRSGVRIGIDTGNAAVGNLGNEGRLIYTAVGLPAELAQTLAQRVPFAQTAVVVSGAVAKLIADRFELGPAIRTEFVDGHPAEGFELLVRKPGVEAPNFGKRRFDRPGSTASTSEGSSPSSNAYVSKSLPPSGL
jgi:hypothetical protein